MGVGPALVCLLGERERFVDPRQGARRVLTLGFELGQRGTAVVPGRATASITRRNTAWDSRTGSTKPGWMEARSSAADITWGSDRGPW